MNAKVRRQLNSRKRRIARRLEQAERCGTERPEMAASNIQYEIADAPGRSTPAGSARLTSW